MSDTVNKLLQQAFEARRENRLVDAKRDLEEAVHLCRKADAPADLARALAGLGRIERDLHQTEAARQHYAEAADIYRVSNDPPRLAHTIRHLGDIHLEDGRPDLAEPCYNEALELYRRREQTSPLDLANAIRGLAILKQNAGEAEPARSLWSEARELYASTGVKEGVAENSRRLTLLAENR